MWRAVTKRNFAEHSGKDGKPDTVKATFYVGGLAVNNWLCPGHSGFAKTKADKFWKDHGGDLPYPNSAVEFLLRQFELAETAQIELEYNGKYANARNYVAGEFSDGELGDVALADELDDEIPF
jgi:DNA repair protein RadD